MAEGAEVEERVDLDEDNYMEEMDDDVEEQIDEDGVDGGSDENVEEHAEEAHEDPLTKASNTDHPPEPDESHSAGEFVEDGEKPSTPVNEEEKEKHAQLLALPPCGSEVFIGGLPKDTSEEDLRDLCDEIGEIIEVRTLSSCACDILALCLGSTGVGVVFSVRVSFFNYFAGKINARQRNW